MRNMRKKPLAIVLTLSLCAGLLGTAVSAVEDGEPHVHDESCGYVAAVEGRPCAHEHDEACGYAAADEGAPCGHQHDETCGEDGTDCTHVCDETCGYREPSEGRDCAHQHDEACGYMEAVEGQPCTYVPGKEITEDNALSAPSQQPEITVSNPLNTISGGREMNNGTESWYTYCVDPDAVYPETSNTGYYEIAIGSMFGSEDIAVLERALTAGYPINGVAAIRAIAQAGGLTDKEMAQWTQAAIWCYLMGTGIAPEWQYCYAIYEYAMYGTFQGQPIEPQQVLVLNGLNEDGEVELILDEATGLYTGTVVLSHVAEDMTLAAIPGGMAAYVDGAPLTAGSAVTGTVITVTADSPELHGSLEFSYTAQTSVTDLKLFASDEIASESSSGKNLYQKMLGYRVIDVMGSTMVMVVSLPQADTPTILPPDTTPEPGPSPGHTPEPSPIPDPGHTPEPPVEDIEDIPEEEPPLAELPETDSSDAPAEGPSLEDVIQEEEIADEDVPMADAPKTGDSAALWLALTAASGLGLIALALTGRRHGKEEI